MGGVSPETAEQIVNGGTVGLIAFLLVAITALVGTLGLLVRAFLKRTIITRETYDERERFWTDRLAEVVKGRDEALGGWKEQTRMASDLTDAVEKLTAALEARNSLDLEFHQGSSRRSR